MPAVLHSLRSLHPKQPCRRLLRRNPDNHAYHHGLRAVKLGPATQPGQALSEGQLSDLVQLYQELRAEFPRSMAVRRLPLDFLVCVCLCVGWVGEQGELRACGGVCWFIRASRAGPLFNCMVPPSTPQMGDAFEAAAEEYIKRFLEKGIPSLFSGR